MAVFGSQRPGLNRAKYTHSFAVFVRVTGEGCPAGPRLVEVFAISWLPVDGSVELRLLLPQPGVNLDLYKTLQLVQAEGERVSMWGPYRIQPELYRRAVGQRAWLERGGVRYKAVDTGFPAGQVSNCIHAVMDLDGESGQLRRLSPGWGKSASYHIIRRLLPWVIDPGTTHDWVAAQLGLGAYPIVRRRPDEDPAGPLLRLLHAPR
jgi:hypothetical protein